MHGHVEKKGANWYIVLERDRDDPGERKRTMLSARKELGLNKPSTKKQAQELLVKKLNELQTGTFVEPNEMTLAELLKQWMEVYCQANLRPTTYATHDSYIKNHIIPELGAIPLAKLKPLQIQKFLAGKLRSGRADKGTGGLSPNTVKYFHKIIRKALDQAVKWELVQRNVADAVTPPKTPQGAPKAWASADAKKFLGYVADHRLYPLYLLAISTGMRRGELIGLRWADIDRDRKALSVKQTIVVGEKGRSIASETKTDSSKRAIALSPAILAALEKHRKSQREELLSLGQRSDLVFTSERGTAYGPRNLLRHFQTTSERAKVPVIPFHGLRHTCATLMLQAGVHPKVVAERLGHSKISTTLDIYSHVMPDMQEDAAQLLEDVLR